jgi:chromosome segregation ATPase
MPSNWLSFDSDFPSFTGEETPEQQIRALHNYLFQLREGLQYSLQNLTADNFNTTALQNMTDAQKNEVTRQLEKVYTQLSQMTAEIDRLSSRVSSTENLSGRMTTAEGEITALEGRTKLTEENIEFLADRTTAAETDIDDLQDRMKIAEADVGSLKGRAAITEGNVEELAGRVKQLEDDYTLDDLQEAVTGEGGLQEQMDTAKQELEKISGAVQVADDGGVTMGSERKPLRLVGQIYINGVLYEQGGTA